MLDAIRLSDGMFVTMKSISANDHPFEAEIGEYLSSPSLASDPTNHCVPIYEVLRVPDVKDRVILVMPLLRPFEEPPFETIGEAIDFFQQVLEVNTTTTSLLSLANIYLRALTSCTSTM